MPFTDLMVHLSAYPLPATSNLAGFAIDLAKRRKAHVTAQSHLITLPMPVFFRTMSDSAAGEIASAERECQTGARGLVAAFAEAAGKAGVAHSTHVEPCSLGDRAALSVERARLHDLSIVSFGKSPDDEQGELVERLIFESGRPVLGLPDHASATANLRRIVVAWDFSKPAARALGDALPLLREAEAVRIVTVTDDKPLHARLTLEDVARHVERNGVKVEIAAVERRGDSIGQTLQDHAISQSADLLVMGAYGHSRMREFFVGGATRDIMSNPRLPVLFSN